MFCNLYGSGVLCRSFASLTKSPWICSCSGFYGHRDHHEQPVWTPDQFTFFKKQGINLTRMSTTGSGFPSGHGGFDFVATNRAKMTSVVMTKFLICKIPVTTTHVELPTPDCREATTCVPFQPSFKKVITNFHVTSQHAT